MLRRPGRRRRGAARPRAPRRRRLRGPRQHARPPGAFCLLSPRIRVLGRLVVAFLCHYNALQYYRELAPRQRTPRTYARAAGLGAALTALVFAGTLFGGVAAFGADSLPNLLNNFSDTAGAALARLGTGVAILSGFPLMFAGLKAALDGALPEWTDHRPRRVATHALVLAAVGATAAVASEEEIGLIIELLGSTLGCCAVYVVPGLCAARTSALPDAHRAAGACVAGAGALLSLGGSVLTFKTHAH